MSDVFNHNTPNPPVAAPEPGCVKRGLRVQQWVRVCLLVVNVVGAVFFFSMALEFFGVGSSPRARSEALYVQLGYMVSACVLLGLVNAVSFMLPVRWDCPHCARNLNSEYAWRCKACGEVSGQWWCNFLLFCGHFRCRRAPTGFACPHCQGVTYFTSDATRMNAKVAVVAVDPEPVTPQALRPSIDEVRAQRAESLEAYQHEVWETQFRIQLAELKRRLEQPSTKDLRQVRRAILQAQVEEIVDKLRSVAESATTQRAVEAEFDAASDDPEFKRDMKKLVRDLFADFRQKQGGEIGMDDDSSFG